MKILLELKYILNSNIKIYGQIRFDQLKRLRDVLIGIQAKSIIINFFFLNIKHFKKNTFIKFSLNFKMH